MIEWLNDRLGDRIGEFKVLRFNITLAKIRSFKIQSFKIQLLKIHSFNHSKIYCYG